MYNICKQLILSDEFFCNYCQICHSPAISVTSSVKEPKSVLSFAANITSCTDLFEHLQLQGHSFNTVEWPESIFIALSNVQLPLSRRCNPLVSCWINTASSSATNQIDSKMIEDCISWLHGLGNKPRSTCICNQVKYMEPLKELTFMMISTSTFRGCFMLLNKSCTK